MVTTIAIKRAFLIALLAFIVCIGSGSPAYSGIPLKNYESVKDLELFKVHLGGVGDRKSVV